MQAVDGRRSLAAGLAIACVVGVAAWTRSPRSAGAPVGPGIPTNPTSPAAAQPTPAPAPTRDRPATAAIQPPPASLPPVPSESGPTEPEEALMARLRQAPPREVLKLARQLHREYPRGQFADERDSRAVDAWLALGQIGEAHYRAQLFVQHYPDSPFAHHVMNLMGVHPRPPGVVPEPADNDLEH
jgi:hypothetical protein